MLQYKTINYKRLYLNIARQIAANKPLYLHFIPADMTKNEKILLFCFMAAAEDE